jgi:hypothetical protein
MSKKKKKKKKKSGIDIKTWAVGAITDLIVGTILIWLAKLLS